MEKIKAFFNWILANKKSLSGTVVGAVGTGLGITAAWTINSLPAIMIKGFNAAPIIYTVICAICFILNELGISGKGFESVKTFVERKLIEEEKANQAAIERKALEAIEADKARQEEIKRKEARK